MSPAMPHELFRLIEWALVIGLCVCAVLSFAFMVRRNNPISTILWVINPLNWILPGWGSYDLTRQNPTWLRMLILCLGTALVALLLFEVTYG